VLRIVDKMEKITRDEFIAELKTAGLNDEQADKVLAFTSIAGDNDAMLRQLRKLGIQSQLFEDGLAKLETLINALRAMGVPESRFKIDLKIARGLDYYTGTVYETVLDDHPEVGSVCSGGRYDDLAGYYTKTELPGVGISIGLSRLFYKLLEAGIITPTVQSLAEIVVMPFGDGQIPQALAAAALLRDADIPTMLYTEPGALKKKLGYADKMGFHYVVLIGAKEAAEGNVTVKNMLSGESMTVPISNLLENVGH
jgi:histidyl-tRNA synthetase